MLQQTQAATVIPYFERFMEAFPKLQTLAEATLDDVLAHWSGLGYYARGRNLHKAAQRCMQEHDGQLPVSPQQLQDLPGIGRSTANAIAAQAFGLPVAILDGNVKRVMCRLHGIEGWPGKAAVERRLWELAQAHMPTERVADYTQAIMDLGATLCTRRRPDCQRCPVHHECQALAQGLHDQLPTPRPKKVLPTRKRWWLKLEDNAGRLLLTQRPASGLWGGLWCLPEFDSEDDLLIQTMALGCQSTPKALTTIRHSFSHYHLHAEVMLVKGYQAGAIMDASSRWLSPKQATKLGLPTPVRTVLERP